MDYDTAPPMPVENYRRFQGVIPGVEGLYLSLRAIIESAVSPNGEILIVGAGGGREIETLAASTNAYRIAGVDPSRHMLDLARNYLPQDAEDRICLIHGTTEAIPAAPRFAAATSILVMHFLPDDGAKLDYLRAIRARLMPGAAYIHVDMSVESGAAFERLTPVFEHHARLNGFEPEVIAGAVGHITAMVSDPLSRVVGEARTIELFAEAGLRLVAPFFRGLWHAGWWCEAA